MIDEKYSELPHIYEKWLEHKKSKIKQYPTNTLRASQIGFPCDRYHYYSIANWKDRQLHDEIMQSIFDEGNLHEKAVIQELQEMGFEIVEYQRSLQNDKPLITGHIDGILRWEGKDYPFDVKSISYDFDSITSAEDLLYSKKLWHRSYVAQLQLYLYLCAREEIGCFILKNKMTGEIKPVWMQIDYDYVDSLLKRAERVYEAIEKKQPPAKINDFNVCGECAFRHICLPDIELGEGVTIMEDKTLEELLKRWWELKDAAKEFEKIDETIKNAAKAAGKTGEKIVGDFVIRVTSSTYKRKIPLTYEIQEQEVFKTQIAKING